MSELGLSKVEEAIGAFLAASQRSAWVHSPQVSLYLRRGFHMVAGSPYHLLDLANVTVEEEWRRRGIFAHCLAYLQEHSPLAGVRVENIHNPVLRAYMLRLRQKDPRWIDEGFHVTWIKGAELDL